MNLKQCKILPVIFLSLLIELSVQNEDASCLGLRSGEHEAQCSSYCYDIVKPLLRYAAVTYPKEKQFDELGEKNRDLEKTIRHMEERLRDKQKQLEMQIELGNVYKAKSLINEELLKEKNKQIEELENRLKLIQVEITTQPNEKEDEKRNEDIQKLTLKLEACEKIVENNKKFQVEDHQNHKETCQEFILKAIKTDEVPPSRELIIENHSSNNCLGKSTDDYISTVLCDWKIAGAGWTVIQRRQDGSVNFNRNWEDYKNGFGDLRGEFFIGLEKLSRLTQSHPHELYIHLEDFHNEVRFARYSHFLVGNESESYVIKSFGEYSGNADNALAKHKGYNFITPDRTDSSFSCAAVYKSGWWYNLGCYECNLNAPYYNASAGRHPSIEWRTWHFEPLKFVQMMIRPAGH